jgi:hypothetical protein
MSGFENLRTAPGEIKAVPSAEYAAVTAIKLALTAFPDHTLRILGANLLGDGAPRGQEVYGLISTERWR